MLTSVVMERTMYLRSFMVMALAVGIPISPLGATARPGAAHARNADLAGRVTDSLYGKPIAGAEIVVTREGTVVSRVLADQFGAWRVHDLAAATYQVEARLIGFRPATQSVTIGSSTADVTLDFKLVPAVVQLSEIGATTSPVALNTRTGDQVFKESDYQGAPTQTTSQILQQSIAGAARAPTGEVHIRGQHAEYTYYIDGLPVPPGISGSLNELFDPSVVNTIDFQTGGWDAEYGKRNAAIVNVQTKVPAGPFHLSATGYAGNYASNGQTLTMSANSGKFGFFVAGTRQATDMRREPVVADTNAQGKITGLENFANDGQDLFGFAKAQYVATDHDLINLDVNLSRSRFATPFDSSVGVIDDRQQDINHFVNLSWQHRDVAGPHAGSEAFAGVYYRHGSLNYVPGANDDPTFSFQPDTTLYNIAEARSFNIIGFKADYLDQLTPKAGIKFGVDLSRTSGSEAFSTTDANDNPGPASNSPLDGHDEAAYVQSVLQPSEKIEFRVGARYDSHTYPVSATDNNTVDQLSPRFRVNLYPGTSTTLWFYYGRLFIPTNTEDLRAITTASTTGSSGTPTVPERDHFFEVGYIHRFNGIVAKISGYYKRSSPGIDDTQIPGSAITTDVNIAEVRITGIEGVLEVRPGGALSGFANIALNHAYGTGAITGAFLAETPPTQPFDLDHDQRLSSVVGLTWSRSAVLATVTGIYGSGLTNGVTPNAPGLPGFDPTLDPTPVLGTGLFDFNKAFKVDPSFIVNGSLGWSFQTGGVTVRPQFFVDNVFDLRYALKGAFFSGASFGRPRTFSLRVTLGV
ncbi:MAG TPA: TonB-dependent receptor [Gemmatimonadales bacterium]